MYIKQLFLTLLSLFLLVSTIEAKEEKIGKFLGGKNTTMPSWFINSFLDLSEDVEELASENKRLILFIHQDNCPYCNLFVTKNLKNENIKRKVQKHFGVVDINMAGDRTITDIDGTEYTEKEFARKYKVQFTPTLLFFDKDGKQLLRLNGYMSINKFNLALNYIRNKRYERLTYKEYISLEEEDNQIATLIKEPDLFQESKNFVRKENSKKMAIFFELVDCSECETLHEKLMKNEETRALLKKFDLFQINMNSSKSIVTPEKTITKIKDWSKELNITNAPSIIFFDEKGKEVFRIESLLKNFHFQSIVDYVISDSYKEEKEFQRYLTKRANKIREKGIDVNIWE